MPAGLKAPPFTKRFGANLPGRGFAQKTVSKEKTRQAQAHGFKGSQKGSLLRALAGLGETSTATALGRAQKCCHGDLFSKWRLRYYVEMKLGIRLPLGKYSPLW